MIQEAKAEKKIKRAALVRLLRQIAAHVQQASDNNLETRVSSGFHAANSNSAQMSSETPAIKSLLNGISGHLIVRVKAVSNARCYETRVALVAADGVLGPWQSGGHFTNSRSIRINGLTPGGMCEIQTRVIGGSTGTSDWSDPKQHRSL